MYAASKSPFFDFVECNGRGYFGEGVVSSDRQPDRLAERVSLGQVGCDGLVGHEVDPALDEREGLIGGICNGYQALIKLGLVPYGRIVDPTESSPTLTFNRLGRHQSRLVRTRVSSVLSPWLMDAEVGKVVTVAISHGEGRLVADETTLASLAKAGQIATQYVDAAGRASMDIDDNPNGSDWAIEGLTSPDGRVFGKMGHSERSGNGLYVNVPGDKYQPIFEGGVNYFKL